MNKIFTKNEIEEIVQSIAIDKFSQVAWIVRELLENLNNWFESNSNIKVDNDNYIESIKDIISELRGCHVTDEIEMLSLIRCELDEFYEGLKDFNESEQNKAKELYDHFWSHRSISNLINTGKIKDYQSYPILNVDNLETVAGIYINTPWMTSKSLEVLLIDSFVFMETLQFAIDNNIPSQKFWDMTVSSFWQTIKFIFNEGIALIITAFFASLVDSSKELIFWIVFSLITIIRWVNPNRALVNHAKAKPRMILADMLSVYDGRFKNRPLNAKLIRELLYDLERKGAVYSPWVYHVLDKMIKY